MDNRGMETEAYKVRYINFNGNNYFIYTLNEIDNDGYVKLYLKKINGNEEEEISVLEWDEVKNSIPKIVKEIRDENITSFKDLSMRNINEIMDGGYKVFKLKNNIVELITYIEPISEDVPKFEMNDEEDDEIVRLEEDTPVIEEEVEEEIDLSQEKINALELEITKLKEYCIGLKKQNDVLRSELNKSNTKLARLKSLLKDI